MKVFQSCSSSGRLVVLLLTCVLLPVTITKGQYSGGSSTNNGRIEANTLLNNRDSRTGTFPNPNKMPYPTSTYVDSRDDPYTRDVPNPMNPKKKGFTDYWGNPLIVDTKIQDVKFCNGTKWSSEPDGIVSWIPEPVLKSMNGVSYYEYFTLLSGQGFYGYNGPAYSPYTPYVYGPIDNNGNDASNTATSPRIGLTYLPVYIAYPAQNWNGRLIHNIHYFSGEDFPFAWFFPFQTNHDIQYLLKQGYAVCMHLCNGGLLDAEKNINAHDKHYWDKFVSDWMFLLYDPNDPWDNPTKFTWKAISRSAFIDNNGNEFLVPGFPIMPGYYPPADNTYPPNTTVHPDASLARNVVHLVKNLLWYRLGRKPNSTYMFGHSRSTETVFGTNCGRIHAQTVPYVINGLTPRTGGNFVEPYNPASGLVYNGFYDRTGFLGVVCADPDFPITAPIIATVGGIDVPRYQLPVLWAAYNIKTTRPDYNLNKWFRYYVVEFGQHMSRSGHFATLYNGSNWFYQFGNEQPNQDGRGSRLNFFIGEVADALTRAGYPPGTLPSDPTASWCAWGALSNAWCSATEAGFIHKCIDNLIAWAEQGVVPPVSRVWGRVVQEPYKVWVPDLPLYYWSDYSLPLGEPFIHAPYEWPYYSWINDRTYCSKLFPDYPLWIAQGNKGIFDLTPYYIEKWGNTYYSVLDTTRNPQAINPSHEHGAPYLLDPFWEYFVYRTLRPVRSDCAMFANGLDDDTAFDNSWAWDTYLPQTTFRDVIQTLKDGQLFNYDTEPLRMPNIAVRLGLYIDGGHHWNAYWPYLDPFSADELLNGYTDPYGNRYAGYANHGDYVNKIKAAVDSLVSQGLYDPAIGRTSVVDEATHSSYPLPKPKNFNTQIDYTGFYSDITNKCYATIEEREKAEERLAVFFGMGFGKEHGWKKAR